MLALLLLGVGLPCLALAAGDGAKMYVESCSPCHSASIRPLDNTHLTAEKWKETVERMIDLGAEVPKGKMSELLDYLNTTHGPAGASSDTGK
jgi:hypothetical protein